MLWNMEGVRTEDSRSSQLPAFCIVPLFPLHRRFTQQVTQWHWHWQAQRTNKQQTGRDDWPGASPTKPVWARSVRRALRARAFVQREGGRRAAGAPGRHGGCGTVG